MDSRLRGKDVFPCGKDVRVVAGGGGHCLRLELGTINTGRFLPPVRSSMVSMILKMSVDAFNVLVLIPLVVSRLDNCPDPSIWDQKCVQR